MIKNLIIGAGPAGVQMASLFPDHLVVDKASAVCSFFNEFPRQRRFISINKGRHLRYDWNSFISSNPKILRDYSEKLYPDADSYLEYVREFSKDFKFKFNFEVKSIKKVEDKFIINDGELEAERVFFGTGLVPKPPPVLTTHPSVKVFTYYDMPLEPDVYRDKFVHIVGMGNAALETADWLAPYTHTTEIWGNERNAWKTHYPGHARSINYTSIDSYYLKARTILHFGDADENFSETTMYKYFLHIMKDIPEDIASNTIIIWCVGFQFDATLVKDLVKVDKFPVLTQNFESTICPNLFFIGAATQYHDYKKGTSAFIHGFRYNCEYLHRYLTNTIKCLHLQTKEELVDKVFEQLNESSALFHRFDQFCDLIGLDEEGAHYVPEIPILAVEQFINPKWTSYFTIKLGYSQEFEDTFQQPIDNHPRVAHKSKFIHPIIQYNSSVFHIPEEATNEFKIYDRHIYPFQLYLSHMLGELSLDEVKQKINEIH
jgi:thioredoxin reductase